MRHRPLPPAWHDTSLKNARLSEKSRTSMENTDRGHLNFRVSSPVRPQTPRHGKTVIFEFPPPQVCVKNNTCRFNGNRTPQSRKIKLDIYYLFSWLNITTKTGNIVVKYVSPILQIISVWHPLHSIKVAWSVFWPGLYRNNRKKHQSPAREMAGSNLLDNLHPN